MTAATKSELALAAKLFRGFGDETRLAILIELTEGERRVTDLVEILDRPQSTISSHVACLRDCGLVEARAEGRQMFYRVTFPDVVTLMQQTEHLLSAIGHEVDLCTNYTVRGEA